MVDQKEKKRKRALIVFQIFIYGYLLDDVPHPALHVLRPGLVGPVNLPLLGRRSGNGSSRRPPSQAVRRSASRITTTSLGWLSAEPTSG